MKPPFQPLLSVAAQTPRLGRDRRERLLANRLKVLEMESEDRNGFIEHPDSGILAWESVASWPEE